jgi:hypothetical protein
MPVERTERVIAMGAEPLLCPFDDLVGRNLQIQPDRQVERLAASNKSTVWGACRFHEAFALSAAFGP